METPSALPLIPTRFKSKIAHTHSYPIGAEAISKALAGVPQFERLELTFSNYKFHPDASAYTVLEVTYRHRGKPHSASREMIERGELEPKWPIRVKPVPRDQRHVVQADLLERGLPFVKKLLLEDIPADRLGWVRVTFSWYETEQRLGYETVSKLEPETH